MYTAVVLCESDCQKLVCSLKELNQWNPKGFLYKTPGGDTLPHHMTLNMDRVCRGPNPVSVLDSKVKLMVDAFCWDESLGVCAARVVSAEDCSGCAVKSTNAQPHITMCLTQGVKPFMSNNLDWSRAHKLTTPLEIMGVVKEC